MREQPLVSVVIPNYNYASTLGACLDAVQAQSYPSIEIIVVDDHSTDGSVAIAERFGVRLLQTPVNSGVSVARNLGAGTAHGEILFFLDSDVALDPDAVANAVQDLRADPALGAICGMYRAEPLLPAGLVKQYRAIQQYVWFGEIEGRIPGLHSALCAMRAEVFREVGPFNDRLRWTEEQEYGFRLNRRYEVRATSRIRGRHDHDATIGVLLRKVFQRTRLGAPNWIRLSKLPGGAATGRRALGSAFVFAAGLSVVPAAVFGPWLAVATALLLGTGMALDGRTFGYAYSHRGIGFGLQFTVLHLLVMFTSALAAGIGAIQGRLFPGWVRRMYGTEVPA
jgi:glycosyltransferase involved in cell wall biosynthesis